MKKKKKIYIVNELRTGIDVTYGSWISKTDIRKSEDGCCGALLCFTNKRKAQKYATKSTSIEEGYIG